MNAGTPDHAACSTHAATEWRFRETEQYCGNCSYVFYVVVDCGSSMHLPTHDVEAFRVTRVTDMSTGLDQLLSAENECGRRRSADSPFLYCDGCTMINSITPKDDELPGTKPADSCTMAFGGTMPEIPCFAWRQSGTTIGWGLPLDPDNDGNIDEDGDGYVDATDSPPCVSCDAPPCPCGANTAANRLTEEQEIDVVLHGSPFLSGVYRIEILGGGLEWQLYSNCDGSATPMYSIYDSCATAMNAWDPVPEFALHEAPDVAFFVADAADCPATVQLGVTTCNRGGLAAVSTPFGIRFSNPGTPAFSGDNAAHPTDPACQRPLEPGECRTCLWDVPLGAADNEALLILDPLDLVEECSERPSSIRCDLVGRRTQSLVACASSSSDADTDGDTVPDWLERNHGMNPLSGDADGDLLGDAAELARGTSSSDPDSDDDGVGDRLDGCPVTPDPAQPDSDGDGVGDACEPGARDVLMRLLKWPDGRIEFQWDFTAGAQEHDLHAGDLGALWTTRALSHDTGLDCQMPVGFAGRFEADPLGVGRSRYYLMNVVLPGPDEWGVDSFGLPHPVGNPTVPCR